MFLFGILTIYYVIYLKLNILCEIKKPIVNLNFRLGECTVKYCSTNELNIESCPQIKKLNVENNLWDDMHIPGAEYKCSFI